MSGTVVLEPPASAVAAEVGHEEYARLLGLPPRRPFEGDIARRAQEARVWYAAHGRPRVLARRLEVVRLEPAAVVLETGEALAGRAGARRSAGATAVLALAASAGKEVDERSSGLWGERPDEAYFLDRFGAAVVERLVFWGMVGRCRSLEPQGETVLPHLSPGCGGWDLADQRKLMALLADGQDVAPLVMLDSGMLSPKNSLLAVFGITKGQVQPTPADACRTCDLTPCRFRRAPYRSVA